MRIPVTILSGYLGAGKTTILNGILAGNHGRRISVLVNDFGSINIDAGLIADADGCVISLTNGCVCCTIGDDLGEALDAQLARNPDHVLLEASGVAEPERIATHAGNWPGFELDAVIVAADAETVRARADDKFVGQLVRNQIEFADLIALTKTDLIGDTRSVTDWLAKAAPLAKIIKTPKGNLPVSLALGITHHGKNMSSVHDHETHTHMQTALWTPAGPVSRTALATTLDLLPETVHRIKGYFIDDETEQVMLLQGVGKRFDFHAVGGDAAPGIVLISADPEIDFAAIIARLDSCARHKSW